MVGVIIARGAPGRALLQRLCSVRGAQQNSAQREDCYSKEKETHFGQQKVTEEEKFQKVKTVFSSVADTYDLMNDLMSCGVHRLWKDTLVQRLAPDRHTKVLDVAGGTGDIAFRLVDYMKNSQPPLTPQANESRGKVLVVDINQEMLDVGAEKAEELGYGEDVSWTRGDAEKLPLENDTFDACTFAFGIRNVVHVDKALSEVHRILRPGGRFLCLEFSRVDNPLLRWCYDQYSFQVIPVMGQLVAQDWDSYQYLVESIRRFPSQEKFKQMIKDAGFRAVTYSNLTFGVAAIHSGFKL